MTSNVTTNGSRSGHEDYPFRPFYDSSLVVLASCIVATNVLVVVLFVRKDYLRTKTNCILVSLALSDFMTGFLSIPLYLLCSLTNGDGRMAVCLASAAFYRCIAVSTMMHILVVTLERYIAVIYPMRYYRIVTRRRVSIVIIIVWLFSVFFAVIQLTWLDLFSHNIEKIGDKWKFDRPYQITGLVLCFTLPLFIMIFCYTRMFLVIRRQVKNIRKQVEMVKDPRNQSIASDKRALVIFASMLGIFVVCWLSWYLILIQVTLGKNVIMPEKLAEVLDFLRFATSLINPLLYTFLKHDFRRATVSACQCLVKRTTSFTRRGSNPFQATLMTEENGKSRPCSWNGSLGYPERTDVCAGKDSIGVKKPENVELVSHV